jgi:ATP-binding cassette subfamily G (WHITE) protein 1
VEDQFPSSHLTNENVTPVHIPLLPPTFMEEMKESDHIYKKYQLSIISQIPILVKRNFITLRRDQFLMHCRLLMHVMIGFIIGGFYRNVGNEASLVFDNFSLLFFTLIFIAFAAQSSMVVSFPAEVPIIRRESFNGWYSVKAYYIAHTLTDIPVQLASAILYCLIVYLMSNQPRDWHRFALFLSVCITTSLLSQSMGYLVGTLLKVQNGVIFGPLSMMPWVILSGYFLHMRDAPIFLQWTFKVSYLRYALEGLMLSIYSYDRPHLPCSEDYCHFISPTRFLQELDMGTSEFSTNMSFILTMLISFKVLSYYALVYQLKHKR